MSAIEELLTISSAEVAARPRPPHIGVPHSLREVLMARNGFFAFESALEVFPLTSCRGSYSFQEWNADSLWRRCYAHLAPKPTCFAQDAFGGQFVIDDAIYSFDPETAELTRFAETLDQWAQILLDNYEEATGQPVAHQWQERNGALPPRHRLVPITPFVLGGDYAVENLVAMESAESMRLRGDLARQLQNLPDGAGIAYEVGE